MVMKVRSNIIKVGKDVPVLHVLAGGVELKFYTSTTTYSETLFGVIVVLYRLWSECDNCDL
jgi:hypothetical protein